MSTAVADTVGFEYVDLNEIDPTIKPLTKDFYNLKILKAELKSTTYKTGDKTGQPLQFVKFTLAIVDHPDFSGRRVFPKPLFEGQSTFKKLRKVMDATGVAQEPGTPLDAWLAVLSEAQPTFKAQVTQVLDRRDPNVLDNDVNWWEVAPAV